MTAFEARQITNEAINEKAQKNREEVARLRTEVDALIEKRAKMGGDRCTLIVVNDAIIEKMLIANLRNDGYKVEKEVIYW